MNPIKLTGLSRELTDKAFPFNVILAGYRGSIAHNMYIPKEDPNSIDDKDLMGVTVPTLPYYLGLKKFQQAETMVNEYDVVTYELRKFISLLYKSNPNVLSLLWLRENHYVRISPEGQMLIDNRNLFVTKAVYKSFTGYAHGQLKRMEHCKHEGYMGEKRKQLVALYGFDCKNAAHLIRLLRMGIEFLNDGELNVHRHDASQLLEIKRGKWTLEAVKEEATHLFRRAEEAYDRCTFPVKPDFDKVNALLINIVCSALNIVPSDDLQRVIGINYEQYKTVHCEDGSGA